MEPAGRRDIKVGIFVAVLIALIGVSVYVLGGSSALLEARYTLNGSWADVGGLKPGALVRLAGFDVGEVTNVQVSDDLGVKKIFVSMSIMRKYQPRIRKDSEARIDNVGLVGDKYVAISMGDPSQPMLKDGDWIQTEESADVVEYTRKVRDILNSTASIGHKLDLMLGGDEEQTKASISQSAAHIEAILNEAQHGQGLVHALVYDKKLTKRVEHTLDNLDAASADLRAVAAEIRSGRGLAHEVIYGKDGAALASQLGHLAGALAELTHELKTNDSLLHAVIYDPQKTKLLDDLVATADSLRKTSEAIERGDGTLGMLAQDPTLYEDLRALVGGAQRNKLLRAYIRRTIQKGEETDASPWKPADE